MAAVSEGAAVAAVSEGAAVVEASEAAVAVASERAAAAASEEAAAAVPVEAPVPVAVHPGPVGGLPGRVLGARASTNTAAAVTKVTRDRTASRRVVPVAAVAAGLPGAAVLEGDPVVDQAVEQVGLEDRVASEAVRAASEAVREASVVLDTEDMEVMDMGAVPAVLGFPVK